MQKHISNSKPKSRLEIFYEDIHYLRLMFKHKEFTLTSFKKSGEIVAAKFNVPQEKGNPLPLHVMHFDCRFKIHEVILKDVPSCVLDEVKKGGVIFTLRLFNSDDKSGRLKEIKMVSSEAFRPKEEGWSKKNPDVLVEKLRNGEEWLKVRFILNPKVVAKRVKFWNVFYFNVELFTESNKKVPFGSFGFPFIKKSQSLDGNYGIKQEIDKGKEFVFHNKKNGFPEMKAYIEHVTEENGKKKNEKVVYNKVKGKKKKVRAKGEDHKTVQIVLFNKDYPEEELNTQVIGTEDNSQREIEIEPPQYEKYFNDFDMDSENTEIQEDIKSNHDNEIVQEPVPIKLSMSQMSNEENERKRKREEELLPRKRVKFNDDSDDFTSQTMFNYSLDESPTYFENLNYGDNHELMDENLKIAKQYGFDDICMNPPQFDISFPEFNVEQEGENEEKEIDLITEEEEEESSVGNSLNVDDTVELDLNINSFEQDWSINGLDFNFNM